MDFSSLKTFMEIQAIQTIGRTNLSETSLSTTKSLFTKLLNELISSTLKTSNTEVLHTNNITDDSSNGSYYNNNNSITPLPFQSTNVFPESFYKTFINSTNITSQQTLTSSPILDHTTPYAPIILKASKTYGVPEKLIASVIKQESNFNPYAVSSAGARGLMQLMPGTAKYLGVTNLDDPEQNIMGGTKYLSQLLKKFDNNVELALAAYNAGPGNVKKYGGIPPFKETMNYVKNVLNYYHT